MIPSADVFELARGKKSGKIAIKVSLSLPKSKSGNKASDFKEYKNEKGFALLRQYGRNSR